MGKFVKMFKSLPPELRLMLAMIGLGTPAGAVYFLMRIFGGPLWKMILYVALAVLVIAIIVFIISRVFGRGARKRSKKMADELASDATSGPTKVDAAAAVKSNNEKFFNAVKQMRKEAHISVYDLPWYVVIGDSGCGKTFLVNNGGLTFSLGKPEGYQLGTLNYNWWFTEDAIFIDMAGRLCNPQDDGDRREWESFLNTIGKGRRGYPINGTVLCVSMEHLLEDPPERHEEYAVIALERLRDLQSKLGVTFATYIVITKCDRLVGFLQYFDRPDKGAIKNQMFGWSRPGEFDELHDPDKFQDVFDSLYARLHELRLRRLSDDADEINLGLAYAFPEEFRRLYEPLQTYVRILFPLLRNPRAVKNLLFRGLYFTSSTQDDQLPPGAVERYGAEGADQLAKLQALFPKTAYFIRDVLFRKVFPEHGLVFRNEQQVKRHKKLAKVLMWGTSVLFVLLLAGFWFSLASFNKAIGKPREDAKTIASGFATLSPKERLGWAATVNDNASNLEGSFAAWFLSMGIGTDRPINAQTAIQARLVETAMGQALAEVDEAMRLGDGLRMGDADAAGKYLRAVKAYLAWHGCRGEERSHDLTEEQFKDMWAIVAPKSSSSGAGSGTGTESYFSSEELLAGVHWYFQAIGSGDNDYLEANPARSMPADSANTLTMALGHVYDYFRDRYARLDPTRMTDESLLAWRQILEGCRQAKAAYNGLMDASRDASDILNHSQLARFVENFKRDLKSFDSALESMEQGIGKDGEAPAKSIQELIKSVRAKWVGYQGDLKAIAEKSPCTVTDERVLASIEVLTTEQALFDRPGLDCDFWETLKDLGIIDYGPGCPKEMYTDEALASRVIPVSDLCPDIIDYEQGRMAGDPGKLRLTNAVTTVREELAKVSAGLDIDLTATSTSASKTLAEWFKSIEDLLLRHNKQVDVEGAPGKFAHLPKGEFWRRDDLIALLKNYGQLLLRGEGTQLLRALLAQARSVRQDAWGIAGFSPLAVRDKRVTSEYFIRDVESAGRETETQEASPAQEREAETSSGRRWHRRSRGERQPEETREPEPPVRAPIVTENVAEGIPAKAGRDFLFQHMADYGWLDVLLLDMKRFDVYVPVDEGRGRRQEDLVDQCREELEAAAQRYMKTYCEAWVPAYEEKKLESIAELDGNLRTWNELVSELDRGDLITDLSEEFAWSVTDILQAIPFATLDESGTPWRDVQKQDKDVADQWRKFEGWMRSACEPMWRKYGLSASDLRDHNVREPGGTPPSRAIGKELGDALRDLLSAIRDNGTLPTRFDGELRWGRHEIPWGQLARICQKHGFKSDEKLTRSVVDFEGKLLNLLSREVTQVLQEIEKRHFLGQSPSGGWPYVAGAEYTESGLHTVDFGTFKDFLVEVHNAAQAFADVDDHLPADAPGRAARQDYLRQCDAWFGFLKLTGDINAVPVDLPLSVQVAAMSENDAQAPMFGKVLDDTLQHVARSMTLDLGLVLPDAAGGDGAWRIVPNATTRGTEHRATWRWNQTGSRLLTVKIELQADERLQKGENAEKTLGRLSPLALCAYLQNYGDSRDRRTWFVLHGWRRDPTEEKSSETVGERLIFTIGDGRSLPEPIRPLF